MKFNEIKDLILTLDKTSIQNITIEDNDFKINISKDNSKNDAKDIPSLNKSEITVGTQQDVEENGTKEEDKNDIATEDNLFVVKSPIVGVFYNAPSPDSDPFVKVGDIIEIDRPLCIIEAMKIMNEIQSEISGEVVEILVNNEDIVEYGQPLIKIRR